MPVCRRGETRHSPIALVSVTTPEIKERTFMLISRNTCPVSARGRGESSPTVSIHDNGQTFFNKKLVEQYFGNDKKFLLVNFSDDRTLTLQALSAVPVKPVNGQKITEADLFPLKYAEKIGGAYASLSSLFRHSSIGYDYKTSGNQSFAVDGNEKAASVAFELPVSLEPKPKTPRAKKEKAAPATTIETL